MTQGEALYIEGKLDEALPVLVAEAESGNGRAMYIIGQYFLQGHGRQGRNPLEGSAWFAKGASSDALAAIGLQFFTQTSGEEEEAGFRRALSEAERAADEGDALALCSLSYVYRLGVKDFVKIDVGKGLAYMKRAADLGFWQAENDLGLLYLNGEELPKDEARGAALLERAAEKGIGCAEYHMAYCCLSGTGVSKNTARGIDYYRRAWRHGYGKAAVELGMRYETGNWVRRDEWKAYQLYKKAADAGDAEAMAHAADCLYEGRGIKKDRGVAVRLYKTGAMRGDAYAVTRVGQIYFERKEFTEAFTYFHQAARQRFPAAQYLTGICLLKGLGVQEDRERGKLWLMRAAQGGNREAAEMLGIMGGR